MVDIYEQQNLDNLTEDQLLTDMELLFYAYRDFTKDGDAILERYRFGRAHHRTVHFIRRNPGITVAGLLNILQITKQSLSRVLRQLIDQDFVRQQKGTRDRRQRLLFLTEEGNHLADELFQSQSARVKQAYARAGSTAVAGYRAVLAGFISGRD